MDRIRIQLRKVTAWLKHFEVSGHRGLLDTVVRLVLFAGAFLRVSVWWQNRSLFIDEANLARNFCDTGWAAYFQPLQYDQYAPPLFCLVQRLNVQWFGQHEYALRLFPLLCSLAAIPLFYRLAKRMVSNGWVRLALAWIFSFSDLFLRYATEAKQYGCDLWVALGIVVCCLERPFRPRAAAALGAAAVWLSMPSVFILFGAGLYFFQKAWLDKDRKGLVRTGLVLLAWCGSFATYYLLLLRPSLGVEALVEWHRTWFFPLFPASAGALRQARDLLMSFPYYTAGHTVLALAAGAAGILSGLAFLAGNEKPGGLLIALPVLACMVASGFGYYSLIPRMLVWAFPLILLVQGLGWQWWWEKSHRYLRPLWLAVWIGAASLHSGWQYLREPLKLEEIRPVLQTVAQNFREGDAVYVSHEAWPATAYYTACYSGKERYPFVNHLVKGEWDGHPAAAMPDAAGRPARRIWLVYSHLLSDVSRQAMQADLKVISGFARQAFVAEQPGACGYLYIPQ